MTLVLAAIALIVALSSVIAINTWRFTSRQVKAESAASVSFDKAQAIERMAQAVRFKTVVNEDRSFDADEFRAFRDFLETSFPLAHRNLHVEVINEHSLLYTWRGTNPSQPGLLLLGHMDVVPVEDGTENSWSHPPFAGAIADGYIWGRGSWDDKSAIMGILESVELLLRDSFQPARDIYVAFGHDEEVHGLNGAVQIAKVLEERQVKIDFVIDEGLAVTDGFVSGVDKRVALVGIAEKGLLSVELSTVAQGGHSSMPPSPDAIGLIARAIAKLEQTPMPVRMTQPVESMFAYVGPEMTGLKKMMIANRWLFGWVLKRTAVIRNRSSVRTTMVPTVFHSGLKENVVPSQASAIINCRILTGQTVDEVLAHIEAAIGDKRVKITARPGAGNPTLPRLDTKSFNLLATTIRQVFPDAIVAPSLVVGRTDSRHYEHLAQAVYRFAPIVCKPEDIKRVHGTDERIGVINYVEAVRFYHQLILNVSARAETDNSTA